MTWRVHLFAIVRSIQSLPVGAPMSTVQAYMLYGGHEGYPCFTVSCVQVQYRTLYIFQYKIHSGFWPRTSKFGSLKLTVLPKCRSLLNPKDRSSPSSGFKQPIGTRPSAARSVSPCKQYMPASNIQFTMICCVQNLHINTYGWYPRLFYIMYLRTMIQVT